MAEFTEEELINGCKTQNRLHQEQLYKNYYSLFLKVCARYAKDWHDAEQLMQDGFLKIYNHIDAYEGKGSFEGWMRRIMVNTCLDYLKSKYLKNAKQMQYQETPIESVTFSVQNKALSNIEMRDLMSLIQELPPMSRTVFNLFVFDGYSHKEISKILGMSEGTSQWHVNNARKNLQVKIKIKQESSLKIS